MRFRIMQFSIYAVLGNGSNSCFMLQYSHIMRFLFKIIVYKILLIFFLHLCDSCIMRFLLGNKKRINGELSVFLKKFQIQWKLVLLEIWFTREINLSSLNTPKIQIYCSAQGGSMGYIHTYSYIWNVVDISLGLEVQFWRNKKCSWLMCI